MTQYIAIIQQGLVMGQEAVAIKGSQDEAYEAALKAAEHKNQRVSGFGDQWVANVVQLSENTER